MSRTLIALLSTASLALAHGNHNGTGERDFDKLKTLVGEWMLDDDDPANDDDVAVSYRLSAGGHVLIETLFPCTDHEMITIYHLDAGDLMLTHYCTMGNEPRMRAAHSTESSKVIRFQFVGGFNMRADRDRHMHDLILTLVDDNHFKTRWTVFDGGLAVEETTFQYRRESH